MDTLDKVAIGMTAECDCDLGDVGRSFRSEHAAGLRHADDDPAYGNGLRLRDRIGSAGGFCQRRHGRESHLAATPVGRTVLAISCVIKIDPKSVVFEVETWDGEQDNSLG